MSVWRRLVAVVILSGIVLTAGLGLARWRSSDSKGGLVAVNIFDDRIQAESVSSLQDLAMRDERGLYFLTLLPDKGVTAVALSALTLSAANRPLPSQALEILNGLRVGRSGLYSDPQKAQPDLFFTDMLLDAKAAVGVVPSLIERKAIARAVLGLKKFNGFASASTESSSLPATIAALRILHKVAAQTPTFSCDDIAKMVKGEGVDNGSPIIKAEAIEALELMRMRCPLGLLPASLDLSLPSGEVEDLTSLIPVAAAGQECLRAKEGASEALRDHLQTCEAQALGSLEQWINGQHKTFSGLSLPAPLLKIVVLLRVDLNADVGRALIPADEDQLNKIVRWAGRLPDEVERPEVLTAAAGRSLLFSLVGIKANADDRLYGVGLSDFPAGDGVVLTLSDPRGVKIEAVRGLVSDTDVRSSPETLALIAWAVSRSGCPVFAGPFMSSTKSKFEAALLRHAPSNLSQVLYSELFVKAWEICSHLSNSHIQTILKESLVRLSPVTTADPVESLWQLAEATCLVDPRLLHAALQDRFVSAMSRTLVNGKGLVQDSQKRPSVLLTYYAYRTAALLEQGCTGAQLPPWWGESSHVGG